MAKRMTAKQLKYFGSKRQRAAARKGIRTRAAAITTRRRVTTMARRKRSNRRQKMKIPLLIMAGAAPGIVNVVQAVREVNLEWGMKKIAVVYGGFDVDSGQFNAMWMKHGTFPLIAGAVASMLASKFGLNRVFRGLPIRF